MPHYAAFPPNFNTETMQFQNPSPQLETVLSYLKAVSDQNPDEILTYLADDAEYHWITPGFDALGPRVKNKEQTRTYYTAISGAFVKDFKVSPETHVWSDNSNQSQLSLSSTTMLRCQARLCYRCVIYPEMFNPVNSRSYQMSSTGELLSGEGQYTNQYMWLFHVEEHPAEGHKPKIKVAKEFFDSLYCARVWGLMKAPSEGEIGKVVPGT